MLNEEEKERFPLSNAQANAEARCPICGVDVLPATVEQAEYAATHPWLCSGCLQHRNETRSKAKVKARMQAERDDVDETAFHDSTRACDNLGRCYDGFGRL